MRDIFFGKLVYALVDKEEIDALVGKKEKDGKLRLNTGEMAKTCKTELKDYIEINERRHLITHKMGKVDAKYMRETPEIETKLTQYKIVEGRKVVNKVKISENK